MLGIGTSLLTRARAVASGSLGAEYRQQLFPGSSPAIVHIRTSTKRGGGSTKNNRDSEGKRLGVKKFGQQYVLPGQILVRQRGMKFHAGQHVGIGRDHTLYALQPGYLKFYRHDIPYPHQSPSTLITDKKHQLITPGTIDDGSKERVEWNIKEFPPVKRPRGTRAYIGIVDDVNESLPRDERQRGRERRFWGREVGDVFEEDILEFEQEEPISGRAETA